MASSSGDGGQWADSGFDPSGGTGGADDRSGKRKPWVRMEPKPNEEKETAKKSRTQKEPTPNEAKASFRTWPKKHHGTIAEALGPEPTGATDRPLEMAESSSSDGHRAAANQGQDEPPRHDPPTITDDGEDEPPWRRIKGKGKDKGEGSAYRNWINEFQ